MFLRRYILLLLTLLSLGLQAQQYPVDVQVFVTPPYPQSLRGYADTFEQKIQAHFLLKDLSTGGRPFVLRFSLEDFQGQVIAQTPDYITPYLVNLSPGVRRTLTNIDFKTLLRYENLYGINEATYNGLLPEGTYFIGLSLYDVATGRPVSNKGRAMIQVRRYSPPVLTMPQKGEVFTKKNAFQNILFQWMPRDIAPFMQYEFTLKEVWDLALVPEEAFMSGRLVYQTKTNAPALQYTNMMPILLENKRYVWQVRALTNNPANPNEQSYFRNNGNSETFYFDLVSNCEAPRMLTAMTESTSAQLRWSAQAMMPNQEYPYKVMYREKGKSWKSQKVSMPYAKVIGLKRGRTYIYKVGVACGLNAANNTSVFGEDSYVYSTEQEFTTTEQIDEKSQVQCGVKPEIRIKNTEPLQDNLYPNTTFRAGDFPVTVLNATGSNGIYSGEGYVKVPYLQDTKIKVVFNGIKLNTERQLIDGKLVTTYDETERNVQFIQEGIGEVFGDKGKKDQKMPFEVAEVQVDSITGRITITGKVDPKTGIAPKVTLPKGKDYVITDSQGKVYQLDESGKVTAKGTREQGTQLAQQAGKGDSKNPPISNKHFKVEWLFNDELANDTNGEIPYKALVKGKTSSFELRIQPADTTKYDFFFHTENGVKVEAESKGEGLYKITRKGAFDFAQEELWVVAKEKKDKKGKKEELIGKCILVHLSPKEVNVALVPTQSGQNLQEAIAKVQQIYEKVGVTLHITTEKPFDISDQLKNGTLPTENEFGDLSTYSPEQNAVIAKFATNRKPKDNTYYIFLVNDGTGNHGYMRLGGQYGFVYSTNARTIAHELGHGIFKLEHPFKGKNADKGKTTALMDYNEGQDFFYRDWKQINDPKVKLYAFQKQSEGELEDGKVIIAGNTDENSNKFDIENSCNRFFIGNKIAHFSSEEIKKINELSITESGHLQYVTDVEGKTYILTQYVETETDKGEKKIKRRGAFGRLVCLDCIDKVFQGAKKTEGTIENEATIEFIDKTKVYSNINKKYIIATFASREECTEGKKILVREGNTYICKTLSKRDCSLNKGLNIGNGNGNGGTVYSLIADEKLSKNLAEKLYSIVAKNTKNTITGENHHLNTRILLSHKNILENTAKIAVHNENGKAQLYVGNEKVAINPDEIVFWIEYDGSNKKISVKEVVVGDNFDQNLRKTLKQWDEKFQYEQASFFGKLFYIGKDLTDFGFTAAYDLFDMLGSGIGKLKIPESVWDCKASNYNPIYAEVFSYLNLSGYVNLITEQIAGEESNLSKAQKEASQANFALFCGMYNGLIDVVKTVPDLGKLLSSFGSSKGRENNSKFVQQLENIEVTDDNGNVIYGKGLGFGKLWFLFKEGISDQFSKDNPCKKNEFIGSIAGPIIVLCFGDVAASESVLAKIGSTSLKALQFCNRIGDPLRYIGISIRYVKNASGKLLIVFRNATGKVAERLESGLYRVRVLVNNTERFEDVSEDVAEELFNGRTAPIGGDTNARLAHTAEDIAEDTAEKTAKEVAEEYAKSERLLRESVNNSEASNALFNNKNAVNALTKARNNPILKKLGFTDEILASLRASGKGEFSYEKILDKLLSIAKKIEDNPNTTLEDFYEKVIYKLNMNSKATNSQRIGAEGVLKAVDDEFDNLLKGKIVRFEKQVDNARSTKKLSAEDLTVEIEALDGSRKTLFRVEVKNCQDCVTAKVIKEQFIERDLFNATDISQIKWRIYGQNFTKQHFEKFLKENKEAIKKLGKEKISKLLKENKMDLKMTIENYTDKLINELIEKNYVQIFL